MCSPGLVTQKYQCVRAETEQTDRGCSCCWRWNISLRDNHSVYWGQVLARRCGPGLWFCDKLEEYSLDKSAAIHNQGDETKTVQPPSQTWSEVASCKEDR